MKFPFTVLVMLTGLSTLFGSAALVKLIQTEGEHQKSAAGFIIFSGIAVTFDIIAIVQGVKELK